MQRWLESYSYDVVVSSLLARLQDVWVCWNCNGREDVSLVRDLSLGGLFLLTRWRRFVGSSVLNEGRFFRTNRRDFARRQETTVRTYRQCKRAELHLGFGLGAGITSGSTGVILTNRTSRD